MIFNFDLHRSPLKLDLHLKNARGVSFDPDPDWTLDDFKTELEAIEEKYSTPLLPENKPSLRSGSMYDLCTLVIDTVESM